MVSSLGRSVRPWLCQLLQDCATAQDPSSESSARIAPTSSPSRVGREVSNLEKRVCFSGTPLELPAVAAEAEPSPLDAFATEEHAVFRQQDHHAAEADQDDAQEMVLEVVFIDETVDGREQVELALERRFGDRALIYTLDRTQDGIDQISDTLMHLQGVEAIHIVSHGDDGVVQMGNAQLTNETIAGYAGNIAGWGTAMTSDADVLFYGCDLAASESGQMLLESVQRLTGADLAASDDATGHASLGGDWALEVALGEVETESAFDLAFRRSWRSLLSTASPPVLTNTINVTTVDDVNDGDVSSISALLADRGSDGEISLREAILAANATAGHEGIYLSAGTYALAIPGASGLRGAEGDLDITDDVSIFGADAGTTIVDAAGIDRVLNVSMGADAHLSDLTLTGGSTSGKGGALFVESGSALTLARVNVVNNQAGDGGGGIAVDGGQLSLNHVWIANNTASGKQGGGLDSHDATVTISNTTFSHNVARDGGGINHDGGGATTLLLDNVTLSGNTATRDGGGLRAREAVDITSSTFFGNSAVHDGGGIEVGGASGSVALFSSILDGNMDSGGGENVEGTINSLGFNLDSDGSAALGAMGDISGVSAGLGTLRDNGGFAVTHTPLSGSAVIDAGAQENVSALDATGSARDAIADMGAVEGTTLDAKLFWTDSDTDSIVRANADGSHAQTIISGLSNPSGITVDLAGGRIYWTETTTDSVMSANLDGSDIQTVTTAIMNVKGITVDSLNAHLYIVQGDFFGDDYIWRTNLDGSGQTEIIGDTGVTPTDVEIDVVGGKIYWTDRGGIFNSERIVRANLDGSGEETIVDPGFVNGPSSLDLDLVNGKIHWIDSSFGPDRLMRANLDGSVVEVVTDSGGADVNVDGAAGLTVDSKTQDIYWTNPISDSIYRLSGGSISTIATGEPSPLDIEFVHTSGGNIAPIADAGSGYLVTEEQSIMLDGSASSDPDGSIVAYEWDFDFDGSFDVSATGASVNFSAVGIDGPATKTVALRVTDDQGQKSIATTTVNISNAAPVTVDDAVNTNESTAISIFPLLNDSDPSPADTLSLDSVSPLSPGQGSATLDAANDAIIFDPGNDFNDLAIGDSRIVTIGYTVIDDDGATSNGSITVTVTGENNAPSLGPSVQITLPDVMEDDTDPAGTTVAQMLVDAGDPISDVDNGALTGIAVISANSANGQWQFSTDGGTSWNTFSVSTGSATLLNDSAMLRFVPNADYHGSSGDLRFRAWDQTVGANGDTGFPAPFGTATGAFSTAQARVSLNVVNVNDAPTVADDTAGVSEGGTVAIDVLGNDFDIDDAIDAGSLAIASGPSHGSLAIVNGSIHYTHNGASGPTLDTFTYRVADASGTLSGTATVTVSIAPQNDAPVAADDSYVVDEDALLTVNAAGGVLSNDTDDDMDPLAAQVFSGPSHGTLNLSSNGSFNYQPDANFFGLDQFTYRVGDGRGGFDQATVQLQVNPVDDAPNAQLDVLMTDEDTPLVISAADLLLNDSDADGDPLTVAVAIQPSNGTVVDNGDGTLTFTPDANFHGVTTFLYTATDPSGLSDSATARVVVRAINDVPIATNDAYTLDEDTSISGNCVLDNDGDIDGNSLTATLLVPTTHGTLSLDPDGNFNYTPDPHFNGIDQFTYQVNDGAGGVDTATVTLTVNPVNDAPNAVDDSVATDEDTPLVITQNALLANDSDIDGDALLFTITAQPSNGVVTDNGDGSLTFTPNANFNGTTSFEYAITDTSGISRTANVHITVRSINDAPVTTMDSFTTTEGQTLSGPSVLSNDADVEGPMVAELVAGPAHGTLTLNADGTFTYVHDGSETTSDSFTYAARDASGAATTGLVQLTVLAANDTPSATDDFFALNEGESFSVDSLGGALSNDFDADSAITGMVVQGPQHGTLHWNQDGSFTYVHDGSETTSDSFRYSISDSSNASDEATVSLNINPVNDAPIATGEQITASANTGSLVLTKESLLTNDADGENDALTIVVLQQPANGVVSIRPDGGVVFIPNGGFSGQDQFVYAVSDGQAISNPAVVELTLLGPQQGPSGTVVTNPSLESSTTEETSVETTEESAPVSTNSSPTAPTTTPAPTPGQEIESGDDDDDAPLGPAQTRKSDEIFSGNVAIDRKLDVSAAATAEEREAIATEEARQIVLQREQAIKTFQVTIGDSRVASVTGIAKQLLDAATIESLVKSVDGMREELQMTTQITKFGLATGFAATSTFSVGYVLWLLRGGYMVATVISSLPAWQTFDPVPILAYADKDDDSEDESLETLMEGGAA